MLAQNANQVTPFVCDQTVPSPHHGGRRTETHFVILHATQMTPLQAVLNHFQAPQSKVSCHYVVDVDGACTNVVHPTHIAWHAGKSAWKAHTGLNNTSVGVELVYPLVTREQSYPPFPQKQIQTLHTLVNHLCAQYKVAYTDILAHSDIAPERKLDPGPALPWHTLKWGPVHGRATGFAAKQMERTTALFQAMPPSEAQLLTWLQALGYAATPQNMKETLWSFACHLEHPSAATNRALLSTYLAHLSNAVTPV